MKFYIFIFRNCQKFIVNHYSSAACNSSVVMEPSTGKRDADLPLKCERKRQKNRQSDYGNYEFILNFHSSYNRFA